MHELSIRQFNADDWSDVREIYEQGLLTRNATFETETQDLDCWLKKFHLHLLWVAVGDSRIVGWAGLQPVSARAVYEGVAEVSIYVLNAWAGKRVGTTLMEHLVEESEKAGIWSLYASIFPENLASIRLHRRFNFREIGYREKIAKLDGGWRDTILFERRSKKVGV
jgi:L-amino acid N-acyltransferase YncA